MGMTTPWGMAIVAKEKHPICVYQQMGLCKAGSKGKHDMKTLKPIALAAALFALSTIPAIAQSQKGGPGGPGGQAAKVIVTTAKKQPLSDRVEALGTLKANETITITTTVTEMVSAVNFTDGQRVETGDVLIEMASGEEKAQLDQAQAVVSEAKQQLDRVRTLAKDGVAPKATLDQRQRDYDSAQGRLREVQSKLKNYLITAPFSGVLGLRNISVGALVQPGTKITTLDDDNIMKLDFQVPSIFLADLQIGTPIIAHAREFGAREFKGVVASLDSQIDPVTRAITVRAVLPNDDHVLRPGLLMSVELFSNARESIVVPEEALIPEGRDNFVLVITPETTIEKRKINAGTRQPGTVEITDGLAEGEKIVTHGTMTARPGQKAEVIGEQSEGQNLSDILSKSSEDKDDDDDDKEDED
jgi:membrane fusion protein (multidrug efflux system)